jgi:predicted Zn-ribbon and HTH transcriptional regulator
VPEIVPEYSQRSCDDTEEEMRYESVCPKCGSEFTSDIHEYQGSGMGCIHIEKCGVCGTTYIDGIEERNVSIFSSITLGAITSILGASCKTCGGYDNDHNRAVDKELCPYCWWKREKITLPMFIRSFWYCRPYTYRDWSKEPKWDNKTQNWEKK